MRPTISLRELEDDAAAVLREVQAGRTFTVSLKGKPVAELRPVALRQFVPRSIARGARPGPRVDVTQLRADLDAVVDPSIG